MSKISRDHFPDHYHSIERQRRMELLESPSIPLKCKVALESTSIKEEVRDSIFRRLWRNPEGMVVALTSDDLIPDNTLEFFSQFPFQQNAEKNLRNLIVCLRYNDLLSPQLLAELIVCFSEYQGDEIATYLDLLHYFQFYVRNARYFDDEVVTAMEKKIPEFMSEKREGLVQYIERN